MYRLRYYCPGDAYWSGQGDQQAWEQHREKLLLLEKIRQAHGIDYELFPVPSTPDGFVDEDAERAIYEEHIVPRASLLIPRLEEPSVSRAFRSRGGRGHYYVVHRIAVLEDGAVGWVTGTQSSCRRFRPANSPHTNRPDELYFREALLAQGPALLRELCFAVEKSPEQRLVDLFRSSGTLEGTFRVGVWLGAGKQVDLLCERQGEAWVLEVKPTLTWEAFGQALGYRWLFSQEHPDIRVYCGVVCGEGDSVIEAVCAAPEFAVTVFVQTDDGFGPRGFLRATTSRSQH